MASGYKERLSVWARPLAFLGHNGITLTGAVLTTSSALTLITFWAFEMVQRGSMHPYAGIILFLILPGVFVFGLLLMPLGIWVRRAKLRKAGALPAEYPKVDLGHPILRRAVGLVAGATALNVVIMGIATYRGVEYMDSQQFCGKTCHTVMAPEYAAYEGSPHSRVTCTECHIGAGASWFVRSKVSGLRQVVAVTLKTYSRPIPSPVQHLRPARETCEHCHWPQKVHGDKFILRTKYQDDETSTPLYTALVLKIGGRTFAGGTGIHGRHLDTKERITYETADAKRQVIPRVTYLDDDGKTVEYVSDEAKKPTGDAPVRAVERRSMDCIDCHNRPTHAFQLPERATDEAITAGRISRELPFVKKQVVAALRAENDDRPGGPERIAAVLNGYYEKSYPGLFKTKRNLVDGAVRTAQEIYGRNVFPEMRMRWGTHPNNIGHEDFPGCFRCHDGNHKSADGKVISQECDSCHSLLAQDDPNPKILTDLGIGK